SVGLRCQCYARLGARQAAGRRITLSAKTCWGMLQQRSNAVRHRANLWRPPRRRAMATAPNRLALADEEIYYPETDGKPMGETEYHVAAILYLYGAMDLYFQKRKVHVAADLFLYYEQGNPRAVKAPDVMVIKGLDKEFRRIFQTWKEKAVPCVVFEVTSRNTIEEDRGARPELYCPPRRPPPLLL